MGGLCSFATWVELQPAFTWVFSREAVRLEEPGFRCYRMRLRV